MYFCFNKMLKNKTKKITQHLNSKTYRLIKKRTDSESDDIFGSYHSVVLCQFLSICLRWSHLTYYTAIYSCPFLYQRINENVYTQLFLNFLKDTI